VVGSQPFGGEGLSGTGPKAGGPFYLPHFTAPDPAPAEALRDAPPAPEDAVQARLDAAEVPAGPLSTRDMPGPTGESNRLSLHPRGRMLCLGPDLAAQAAEVARAGSVAVTVGPSGDVAGRLDPAALSRLAGIDAVLFWGDEATARACARALAAREGPLVPLLTAPGAAATLHLERHVCIDTTASGGNAALLAEGGAQ
jgi:RHH-type proline utilization regulon transcriptional repressor/proline dehydrogenase/delta 1-pyrroline-5-carboxylate dehydrogenase